MQRDLPGEPHAAVDLDRGRALANAASSASSLAPRTARSSNSAASHPATSASASATSGASTRQAAACTAALATSARTSMSAHMCLIAWKPPMAWPNWWRPLAYSTASSSVSAACPTWSAAVIRAPSRASAAATESGSGSPPSSVSNRHSGVSGSSGAAMRASASAAGAGDNRRASGFPVGPVSVTSASRDPRCSTRTGSEPVHCSPTWARPAAAPSTRSCAAAKKVPTSGPGTSARPSSSKTITASASPRPVPTGSATVSSEDPRFSQRRPVARVNHPVGPLP